MSRPARAQYGRHMSEDPDLERPRRNETSAERADRNWIEVLQELRVLQTGTQILTGFLLALAFQPAFADLSAAQQAFYLALIALSALSAVIALAPVAAHRILFREGAKPTIVAAGHVCLIIALVIVSFLLAGVVGFVFTVVLGGVSGWVAGGALVGTALAGWIVVPIVLRMRHRR